MELVCRPIGYLRTGLELPTQRFLAPRQPDGQGQPSRIELVSGLVSYREITQKEIKAAQRTLERQQFALDQHAIVSMTDIRGVITYANDKFCNISGYTRAELLGRNPLGILQAHAHLLVSQPVLQDGGLAGVVGAREL